VRPARSDGKQIAGRSRIPADLTAEFQAQPLAAAFAAFLNARTSPSDLASVTSATLR